MQILQNKYVNGKTEKLSAAADKTSANDKEEEEDYQTTVNEETE